MKRIKEPVQDFIKYCQENVILGLWLAAILALAYGKQAFSTDFYVDAEVIINNPRSIYNWDQIGRFGLIALKMLLGGNWYNPYLEAALFLVTLWCTGMAVCYLFSVVAGKVNTCINVIYAAIFLIFPTYADQFMFRFQAFEIVFAMLLVVCASTYFYRFYTEKNKGAFLLAVCMDIFSFGIYQSMVNLQICFFIAIYLFRMDSCDWKERRRLIGLEMLEFLISFVIYECIVKLFFSGGDYLTNQIGWLSGDLYMTIRNLLAYVKRVLLAMDVFYPITYLVCVGCGIGILVWSLYKKKNFAANVLGIGAMLASPFFLALITGTPTAYRAQCMLPFTCAVMWLYTTKMVKERKNVMYAISVAAGVVFLMVQGAVLMRMQYTQDVIREADEIQAMQIIDRIQQVKEDDTQKPVVFLGHLDARTNGSCYTKTQAASFLSYSVYEFAYVVGVPVDTPNYYNTGRILGFFETLGFPYEVPTSDMVAEAENQCSEMPIWPQKGSIQETEHYIVVRLSE